MSRVEFDPAKDAANRRKHGFALAFAEVVIARAIVDIPSPTRTGEDRRIALAVIGQRPVLAVYVRRHEVYRVISVRIAHRKERRKWLA